MLASLGTCTLVMNVHTTTELSSLSPIPQFLTTFSIRMKLPGSSSKYATKSITSSRSGLPNHEVRNIAVAFALVAVVSRHGGVFQPMDN